MITSIGYVALPTRRVVKSIGMNDAATVVDMSEQKY
jgi:hypothetical protein